MVRVGIIGIGNMGTAHALNISAGKVTGMTLAALCDIKQDRKIYCKKHFSNVPFFANWQDLIVSGKVDAVIIAVPHKLHSKIAVSALHAGLHTLVEKPVDISVTKATELNEAASKTNKVFAIMFNQRTNPLFAKAREIIKSGKLGNIKRSVWIITNWYRTQRYYDSGDWRATWDGEGGGVLINQAPHNLDLWQWICGMPNSVTAFCDVGKFHNIEVEDSVTIQATYPNGAVGTFITSTGECPGTNRLEISGDLGKLVIENGKLKWWKLNANEREFCFAKTEPECDLQAQYSEYLPDTPETAHIGILQNFTNAILYGEELISPGTDGIYELLISNAAYLSAWNGNKKISIPFDSNEFDEKLAQLQKNSKTTHNISIKPEVFDYLSRWKVNW